MKRAIKTLTLVAAAFGLAAPTASWAPSAITNPGNFGITVDQQAAGTKVSGFVTLSWDILRSTEPPARDCVEDPAQRGVINGEWVNNVYAVATMQKGNELKPFNSNYTEANARLNKTFQDCFHNQQNQVDFLVYMIEQVIIPGFFVCGPGTSVSCPGYAIRRLSDVVLANDASGGGDAAIFDVELAVK